MTKNKIILLSSVVSMLYGFDAYAMEALKAKFATAKAAQQAQSNALSPVSPTLTSNTGSSSSVQNAQLQQSGTPSAPSQGAPTISSIWNTAPDQGDYLNKGSIPSDVGTLMGNTDPAFKSLQDDITQRYTENGNITFASLQQNEKDKYLDKGSIPSDVGTLMGNTDPAFKSLRDDITQNYTENGNITFANLQQNEKDKLLNKQITYKGYKDIINSDLLDSGKYNDKGGEFAAFFKAAKDAFDSVNENGVIQAPVINSVCDPLIDGFVGGETANTLDFDSAIKSSIDYKSLNFIKNRQIQHIIAACCERTDADDLRNLLLMLLADQKFVALLN